ncbi:TRAP transporter large permease [Desulfotomaculum nigrificans]|uniref:TRAP transporter large permease n=1 Tax=Desulfotomaculum nigrificans TaxID=1565 RepID=UPI0001FAE709|nr:TRAP transporter large permease [Desulfotomaculum nigrificans]
MIALLVFLVSLFFFILLGVPIFMSLGLSSLTIWLWHFGSLEPSILLQKMFIGLDSFPLMAIPFFMLAGELMNTGGVSRRLVSFSQSLIGWVRGGLGFAVVIACMFMAAILGSASATAAMIGIVMIPAMAERGYNRDFSSALIASAGSIGPIIPPSIPFIIYGVIGEVSIAKLFVAGYIPGIMMGLAFMIYTFFYAKKHNYLAGKFPTLKELWVSFREAILTLLLPVIIMGGILGGIFTPTEAAVVAVVYAFIVGAFIYREIKIKDIPQIFLRAANSTAMVLMVMATATLLSWVLTLEQIPQLVTSGMLSISSSPVIFLLVVNAFMIIVGMFLDAVSALTILTPVLLPAAKALQIDPVLFGVLLAVNLSIGVLTPPVGLNLYVTSSIAKISLVQISKAVMPFIYLIVIALLIMIFFPATVTYLPSILIK